MLCSVGKQLLIILSASASYDIRQTTISHEAGGGPRGAGPHDSPKHSSAAVEGSHVGVRIPTRPSKVQHAKVQHAFEEETLTDSEEPYEPLILSPVTGATVGDAPERSMDLECSVGSLYKPSVQREDESGGAARHSAYAGTTQESSGKRSNTKRGMGKSKV